MPDRKKANRVVSWLADNRAEFEEQGINEDSLAGSVEVGGVDQFRAAIDRLENREVVVRRPVALTSPPRFLLTPGRVWPSVRDRLTGAQSVWYSKQEVFIVDRSFVIAGARPFHNDK